MTASCSPLASCGAERQYFTGDWFGYRSGMKERGVAFSGNSTHFAFGVEGGIERLPPIPLPLEFGDTFEYTGRGEYDLKFDLEKFGGLPYGSLLVRAEHWYGEYGNVSLNTGSLPPAVFPALLPTAPNDQGELFLTNFVITQPLSESLVLYGGKKDVLGAADQDEFAGGDGTEQFVNQAFIANPAFLLGLPYTGFVVGAAMPQSWGMVNVFAYDPKDRTTDFFDIDDLYANGVIVGTEVKVNTGAFDRPGDVHVGGMWKKVDLTDLQFNEPPPGVYPQPVVPGFQTKSDSWTLYSGFDQYLKQFEAGERKGWGLFGRASISDGNPTPLRYFLSAGLGGDSKLRAERKDKWGVGWYYVGSSTEYGPLPRQLFGPRDGTGVEMFYNFQVRPWMNITPDVQYIKPDAGALADEAFVYGLRMNVIL
ncbi:carbohydrate porin [Pirellula sp. SH-Sr6A]|uniref:carbohydrate porin n=1 Tax=Pirellula sp. SH-Sr6A TaxID=1632865 RepID=UPI00143B72E2|nr:carbohydrate porin [Pirellula sp. SH-Sr6A]